MHLLYKVGLLYLNSHTEFYKERLENFKDNNYFVRNTKWRIYGKQSVFGKIICLILFYSDTQFSKFLFLLPGYPVYFKIMKKNSHVGVIPKHLINAPKV